MKRSRETELAVVARAQGGAFTHAQARGCGFSGSTIRRRTTSGAWTSRQGNVYVVAAALNTWATDVGVARLWAGRRAVLSHFTAARLHGLDVPAVDEVWVSVPRSAKARRSHGVRLVRTLRPMKNMRVGDCAVTTVARTLVDLATVMSERDVQGVAHEALRLGRVTRQALARELTVTRGLTGTAALRDVLDDAVGKAESVLEADAARLFARAGLALRQQVAIPLGDGKSARVDFLHPASRVVVELDGLAWHSSRKAMRGDRRRDRLLSVRGYLVLRVTADDLRDDPFEVVAHVRSSIQARAG